MSAGVIDQTAAVWLPCSTALAAVLAESEPPRSDLTLGMVIELRADRMVPGLFMPTEILGDDGEYHAQAPAKIVTIDKQGSLLQFTFDNGLVLPFEPDEIVTEQCLLAPDPWWCQAHDIDSDGTVRHCGAEEMLTFAGPDGREFTICASATRYDDPDGTVESGPMVTVSILGQSGTISSGVDFEIGPAQAREMAAMMARVAASVGNDPHMVDVEAIRLGDDVMTPDGWQTVATLMYDGLCREVAVYTVSDDQAALRLPLGTLVEIRRGGA